ncbi:hypothetical protein [Streptomyces sp. S1]|uniref:hypothetical protein n=1 Tax=Streptomyces sp. S1 TaxID=718288 RepID=UPI003D7437F9
MTTTSHQLARTVNSYLRRRPDETLCLSPVWQACKQHARAGRCVHRGTCPVPKVSPVVVDERSRVLMLQGRTRFRLPEVGITNDFGTLQETCVTFARALGVEGPWTQPGHKEPIQIVLAVGDEEDGLRSKVALRYLYRTFANRCRFAEKAPQVWVPLTELDSDLATRVSSSIGQVVG